MSDEVLASDKKVVLPMVPPFKAGDVAVLLHDNTTKEGQPSQPLFVTVAFVGCVVPGASLVVQVNYYGSIIEFEPNQAGVFFCVSDGYNGRWTLYPKSAVNNYMHREYTLPTGTVKGVI